MTSFKVWPIIIFFQVGKSSEIVTSWFPKENLRTGVCVYIYIAPIEGGQGEGSSKFQGKNAKS